MLKLLVLLSQLLQFSEKKKNKVLNIFKQK